jgi:hypothetical protein
MAIAIQMLEDHDVLMPTDFYRYTEIWYEGQSDTVTETSTYGGSRINFFQWMRLDREYCSGWFGLTVKEVCDQIPWRPHQYAPCYEFARGDIPVQHQVPETRIEKVRRLGNKVITFGKYAGKTVSQVADLDAVYFSWLYKRTEFFNDFDSETVRNFY